MAKQTRSEKLRRLVEVQKHLERMAENDLANVTAARREVQNDLDAVVDAIGSLNPVHQIFASLYSVQVGRLTAKDQHLQTLQGIHENRMLRERVKAERLEEHRKQALEAETREAEDEAIYELLDAHLSSHRQRDLD